MPFEIIPTRQIGDGQTIRVPEAFRIEENCIYLKKEGNVLYLIPVHNPWQALQDGAAEFSPDFMDDRAQPA